VTVERGPTPALEDAQTRGFLFADIRGYTEYLERHGATAAAELLARYRAIVRATIAEHRGAEIRTEGDSFYADGRIAHDDNQPNGERGQEHRPRQRCPPGSDLSDGRVSRHSGKHLLRLGDALHGPQCPWRLAAGIRRSVPRQRLSDTVSLGAGLPRHDQVGRRPMISERWRAPRQSE
jgi:class 3 adenylate cyclase